MSENPFNEETKHVNIKMPISLYKEVEELSLLAERNVSQQIRYMIQEYIKIKKG